MVLASPQVWAQDGRPIAAIGKPIPPAAGPRRGPPERLPKGALALVWGPSLEGSAQDLADLIALIERVEPDAEARALKLLGAGPAAQLVATLRDKDLREANGVQGDAPLEVVVGDQPGTWVIGFGVKDRAQLLRWLSGLDEPRYVPVQGEQVLVVGATSDLPVACRSTEARALCQLGASPDPEPLALLDGVLRGDPTRSAPGNVHPVTALPTDANLYLIFDPATWVERLAQQRMESLRTRHRFEPKDRKKLVEDELKGTAERWRKTAKSFSSGAIALARRGGALELQSEIALTPAGKKALEELAPKRPLRSAVAQWSETPALIHGLLHADPRFAAAALEALEVPPLPTDALDGALAFMVYGVDCDCDAAKKKADPRPLDWAFLFPSAIAIGRTDRGILDAWPEAISEARPSSTDTEPKRQVLRATPNGRFEVQVLPDALVFSAGPGSAAASLRRFNNLPPSEVPRSGGAQLELKVHLRAIDAAIAANGVGLEHRPELLMVEAMRHQLAPLIEVIDVAALSLRPSDDQARLSMRLRLGRGR